MFPVFDLFISWLLVAQKKKTRLPDGGRHLKANGFPRDTSGPTSAPSSFTADSSRLFPSSCRGRDVKSKNVFSIFVRFFRSSETRSHDLTHPLVSVVVKTAVVREDKPPLPPTFDQTGLGTFVEVTPTRRPGGVGTASDVRPNRQC